MSPMQKPNMSESRHRAKPRTRGFSLAELMAVVVIVAILATLALYGLRRYAASSRTTEASAVIQAIRAAQESHKAESYQYLNVTGALGDLTSPLYPSAPDRAARPFYTNDDSDLDRRWRLLGPVVKRRVRFGYACVAGLPGAAPPDLTGIIADPPTWSATVEPWYVIHAESDFDGGGSKGHMVATSFSPEIYSEPE